MYIYIYMYMSINMYTHIFQHIYMYSLLHLECHFFSLESQLMIWFSTSVLQNSVEKKPIRTRLEIEME